MNNKTGIGTWAVAAASAAAGALALNMAAPAVVALIATVAAPPVALTLGAIGGGAAGLRYMRNRNENKVETTPAA